MIAKGKQAALLNDKFSRAALLVLFFFSPRNIVVKPFAVIAGTRPVDFPFKVFLPGDLPGVKFLLAQEPFPHELVYQPIVEVNAHGRLSGPVVRVVVSDGGIIGGPRLAGIADKLKQADGAGAVLVQPEECPRRSQGEACRSSGSLPEVPGQSCPAVPFSEHGSLFHTGRYDCPLPFPQNRQPAPIPFASCLEKFGFS